MSHIGTRSQSCGSNKCYFAEKSKATVAHRSDINPDLVPTDSPRSSVGGGKGSCWDRSQIFSKSGAKTFWITLQVLRTFHGGHGGHRGGDGPIALSLCGLGTGCTSQTQFGLQNKSNNIPSLWLLKGKGMDFSAQNTVTY